MHAFRSLGPSLLLGLALAATACHRSEPGIEAAGSPSATAPVPSAPTVPAAVPVSSAPAPAASAAAGKAGLATPAGTVAIVDGDLARQSLRLNGKPIYPPTCPEGGAHCAAVAKVSESMERLDLVRSFSGRNAKELVALFQSGTMGNACSGGSLFFVTFAEGGTYVFSAPIDHCGGPDPVITQTGTTVTIAVAEHAPSRGAGKVPASAHEYDLTTGVLKKVK